MPQCSLKENNILKQYIAHKPRYNMVNRLWMFTLFRNEAHKYSNAPITVGEWNTLTHQTGLVLSKCLPTVYLVTEAKWGRVTLVCVCVIYECVGAPGEDTLQYASIYKNDDKYIWYFDFLWALCFVVVSVLLSVHLPAGLILITNQT